VTADSEGLVVWDQGAGNGARDIRCTFAGDSAGYAAPLCYPNENYIPVS